MRALALVGLIDTGATRSAITEQRAAFAGLPMSGQVLSTPESQNAMVQLVQAMRESVGVEYAGMESSVKTVLFGGAKFVS